MTFPDHRLERPLDPPELRSENLQDVIPPTERNQDPERSTHELVTETARPLTEEERKAADRDVPVGERVYAPASERVPRQPVPGHRDFVDHMDPATPERQAAGVNPGPQTGGVSYERQTGGVTSGAAAAAAQNSSEPSFTRVPRPSANPDPAPSDWQQERWMTSPSRLVPMGMGWLAFGICGGLGIWLFMRWRRERNKPINRIRREAKQRASQARQTAYELRDRMPDIPDEAARPAVGLGTAALSLALLLWQQSQSRSRVDDASARLSSSSKEARERLRSSSKDARKRAEKASKEATRFGRKTADTVSDVDWLSRLLQLKEWWSPARVELEKISMSKR
jgi:hypothetical protein